MRKLKTFLLFLLLKAYLKSHKNQIMSLEEFRNKGLSPKSILIFSNTALGDTLLSTPALHSLKTGFPESRITLFVHRNIHPLIDGLDCIDDIIDFHGGYRKFFQTIRKLRHSNPDTALLLHSNAPQDIPMAILAGARLILKPETRSPFRNHLSHQFKNQGRHVIEERLELVRAIGCTQISTRLQIPARYLPENPGERLRIGFQLGAADSYKMWPVAQYAELAKLLHADFPHAEFVATGSKNENMLCSKFQELLPELVVDKRCGHCTLKELPTLIGSLSLLITNDTGTLHLAIALGIPTLSLFSPTPSSVFGPYQDLEKHLVIQKPAYLGHLPKKERGNTEISQITVDEVFDAVLKLLPNCQVNSTRP